MLSAQGRNRKNKNLNRSIIKNTLKRMVKEYSNRTLAYLLLLALFISIAGTMISLTRMSKIGAPLISGSATSGTTSAAVTIASTLSIKLAFASVSFGTCRPDADPGSWFQSDNVNISGSGTGQCTNLSTPQNLTIENDGSVDANISFNITGPVDLTGGTAGNKSIWWTSRNVSNDPGCSGNYSSLNYSWTNMTNTTWYWLCANLTYPDGTDQMALFFGVWAPSDSTAGTHSVVLNIKANQALGTAGPFH
jgi:hypothetical protein